MADNDNNSPHSGDQESSENSRFRDILASLFAMQSAGGPQSPFGTLSTGERPTMSLSGISLEDLARFMSARAARSDTGQRLHRHIAQDVDDDDEDDDYMTVEDDDDDEDDNYFSRSSRQWFPPVTEPQEEGVELLKSGDFGRIGVKTRSRNNHLNTAKSVLNRAAHPTRPLNREDLHSNLVPNTHGTTVATYDANVYTAQFSDDASFYYTCAQDFKLHIFDMRAPPTNSTATVTSLRRSRHDSLVTKMPVRKVIQGHPGRWTITDANLSPDNERMIYSSITPTIYMTSTAPDGNVGAIPIPFADPVSRPYNSFGESFGIWSCRFSADGNEVIAGGSGKIFVYDLLANKRTVKIAAHDDDVNSCCWADTGSGNVLVSASDDTFIKVWDRRSLGASKKPSGVLVGHTEGLTYVSAKGDGRYIISNGKDQALRLWDLRKMCSSADFEAVEGYHYGINNFDYRDPRYPRPKYKAHPKDCSVMTYRGHSVLRTLIRCHFSPAETTGSQYIYSGSADGKIHIWSLDGRVVQVLDRSKTLPASYSPSGPEPSSSNRVHSNNCVRDVSWHSQEPVILSAGWEHGRGGTVIARHEYKGLSKMPGALEDWVEKKRLNETVDSPSDHRRSRRIEALRERQHVPGAFHDDGDEGIDF